jgi:hypothetical protein
MTSRAGRYLLAIGFSVALHAGLVVGALGLALWKTWPGPTSIEIEVHTAPPKDLPLGAPPRPAPPDKPRKKRGANTVATGPRALADAGVEEPGDEADAGIGSDGGPGGDAGPVPRDLRPLGPEGSRVTVLLRLDRLREAPRHAAYTAVTDALLDRLPDRHLVDGSQIDVFRDFDSMLIATPNPLDARVTFLAVRHSLPEDRLMDELRDATQAAGRSLSWSREEGRPVGRRTGVNGVRVDDRLFVLPEPRLAIIAPPVYAKMLLAPAPDAGGVAPDWRQLVARIDAEGGAMPEGAVLMATAANLLGGGGAARSGPLAGRTLPEVVNLVVSLDPEPRLLVTGFFATETEALAWQQTLPGLRRTALGNPLLVLSGAATIVSRMEITREGGEVAIEARLGHDEALRLLHMAARLLPAR